MDTVPSLFIESVCLRLMLMDRPSLLESTWIPYRWGEICSSIRKKMHTLRVLLDGEKKKIYAAAYPLYYNTYSNVTSLDSVDPKFITNFRIETATPYEEQDLPGSYKEITLDDLQRLLHFIRLAMNEQYDSDSINVLNLGRKSEWINEKLLSMQLPFDLAITDVQ
uniref:RNA-directed RNA polymerase n=1 Tax=Steinernema glaseri TaxID=37863 RepID=A0A1I7YK34_9BILA